MSVIVFARRYVAFRCLSRLINKDEVFATATHVADFTCTTVQHTRQIIFFILAGCDHAVLLSVYLPAGTDFRVKMNINFIFIEHRVISATSIQRFTVYTHFFILVRIAYVQSWRGSPPDKTS